MPPSNSPVVLSKELRLQAATKAYINHEFSSYRVAAAQFNVPWSTLRDRVKGMESRVKSHILYQTLTEAEEDTIVRWITRLTRTGFPITPRLAIEMAEEIREGRVRLSRVTVIDHRPIHHSWLKRFKLRHPEVSGRWSRCLERDRFDGATQEVVQTWFNAVVEEHVSHRYPPHLIFNMDESGFAVGLSQSSRVLVTSRDKTSWKKITGKTEWITAIECIRATGEVLAPMIIYKATHLHSGWIPASAPSDWRFATSNKGWTNDTLGFEWISNYFEPLTRPEDPSERRLLIVDGHGSHITAKFVSFAIAHSIDLLVFPPHCTHVLQPLDLCVFGPLKRALSIETDAIVQLSADRIPRVEWTQAYIRARAKAISPDNVKKGFKKTGLWPLCPSEVLDRYSRGQNEDPSTPQNTNNPDPLDLTFLNSSPPDSTELAIANAVLNTTISASPSLPQQAKRYVQRQSQAVEKMNAELIALRKHCAKQEELLKARKKLRTGKRIALKGVFSFSRDEILTKIVEAEAATAARSQKKGKPPVQSQSIQLDEEGIIIDLSSDEYEAEGIIVGGLDDDSMEEEDGEVCE